MGGHEFVSKERLLEELRAGRERLEATLARVSEEQLTAPGAIGDWSVKDLLAHLIFWEQTPVRALRAEARGERGELPSDESVDQLNARAVAERRERPPAEVLAEFERSYHELLEVIAPLSDAELNDPSRYAWTEGKPLWRIIAGESYLHYREHDEEIRAWLDRTGR